MIAEELEILDLVDEHDQVIGQIGRKEFYSAPRKQNNIRVVNGFVRNSEGKLWIPRRTLHKSAYPGGLDFSVAGHVSSGETYIEALRHEAIEELNLDIDTVPYKEIGYFKDGEHGLHCFMKVYELQSDEAPHYNPDDFSEAYWLTPEEAARQADADPYAKHDISILIQLLYL